MSSLLQRSEPIYVNSQLIAVTMYLVCNVSIQYIKWMQRGNFRSIKLALKDAPQIHRDSILSLLSDNPIRIIENLGLNPSTKTFVCCTQCFSTYDLDNRSNIPNTCSFKQTPTSTACDTPLWVKKLSRPQVFAQTELVFTEDHSQPRPHTPNLSAPTLITADLAPSKTFTVHNIKEWIGRLYSRPDMEKFLEQDPVIHGVNEPMVDIWDGNILRNFCGYDQRLWFDRPHNEGRLIFAFNYDGLNPYGNKEAGKKVSICGLYLVCLNLPRAIRYNIANMCILGVIPGPREPSLNQLNHCLRPIVNDFLFLWYQGIFLSHTHLYPDGRWVRAAIVPAVLDRLASDQVSGHSFRSKHCCRRCWNEDADDLDYDSFRMRSNFEHRLLAERWQAASSEPERQQLFDQYHIRWTEFNRLPYWDFSKFPVFDTMHGFYQRMLHHHVRKVWGMNIQEMDGWGKSFDKPSSDAPTAEEMTSARATFRDGSSSLLRKLPIKVLRQLCRENELRHGLTKSKSVGLLLAYVRCPPFHDSSSHANHFQSESLKVADPNMIRTWINIQTHLLSSSASSFGMQPNQHWIAYLWAA